MGSEMCIRDRRAPAGGDGAGGMVRGACCAIGAPAASCSVDAPPSAAFDGATAASVDCAPYDGVRGGSCGADGSAPRTAPAHSRVAAPPPSGSDEASVLRMFALEPAALVASPSSASALGSLLAAQQQLPFARPAARDGGSVARLSTASAGAPESATGPTPMLTRSAAGASSRALSLRLETEAFVRDTRRALADTLERAAD